MGGVFASSRTGGARDTGVCAVKIEAASNFLVGFAFEANRAEIAL